MQEFRPDTLIKGRYKILKRIGEGGFAVVYSARDEDLGRNVALKFLKLSGLHTSTDFERFIREARTLSATKHPNIVSVYSCESMPDGQVFIVMEYLQGIPLSWLIETHGKLAPAIAKAIMLQVCCGLGHAHQQNVVHRDLSPSNIFLEGVSPDFKVKILDFGLAKSLSETDSITKTGALLGNPAYMSPELSLGNKVNQLSDIYSFGLIMYEALTGRCAFASSSPIGFIYQHKSEYPKDPILGLADKNQEDSLKAIVLRCIQKEPELRFKSCQELAESIENEYEADTLLSSLPASSIVWHFHKQPKQAGKRQLLIFSALLIICASIPAAIIFQDQFIIAFAKLIKLMPLETTHFWEAKLASYLISKKKLDEAIHVYENMLAGDASVRKFQDYAKDALTMTYALCLAEEQDKAFACVTKSWQVLKQEANTDICFNFINSVCSLSQQSLGIHAPTLEELSIRASLLNYLIEHDAKSGEPLRTAFNLLLKRSIEYAKRSILPVKVLESLKATIHSPRFYLKSQELSRLKDLCYFIGQNNSNEIRELIKVALVNPGMTEELKEDFQWIMVTKLAGKERQIASLRMAKTAKSPGIRSTALAMLAQDAMAERDFKRALAFLQESIKSATYQEDNGLVVLRCQLEIGDKKAALKTFKQMLKLCRDCMNTPMISDNSDLDKKMDVYRDIVGTYGTGFTMSYTYAHSAESLFMNAIQGGILLGRNEDVLKLIDDLLKICDKYPWLIQTERSRSMLEESIKLLKFQAHTPANSTEGRLKAKLSELKRRTHK